MKREDIAMLFLRAGLTHKGRINAAHGMMGLAQKIGDKEGFNEFKEWRHGFQKNYRDSEMARIGDWGRNF